MNSREKRLLAITLALLVILCIKSVIFDPQLGNLSASQSQFAQAITRQYEALYGDAWWRKVTITRLIAIKPISERRTKQLADEGIANQYPYEGQFRVYLLGVIPIYTMTMLK